jgi:hypothetical protein
MSSTDSEGVHLNGTSTTPWQATQPIFIQSSPPHLERNRKLMPHPRVLRRNGLTYPIPASPESPTLQIHVNRLCTLPGYNPAPGRVISESDKAGNPVPLVEPLRLPTDAGEYIFIFLHDLC